MASYDDEEEVPMTLPLEKVRVRHNEFPMAFLAYIYQGRSLISLIKNSMKFQGDSRGGSIRKKPNRERRGHDHRGASEEKGGT